MCTAPRCRVLVGHEQTMLGIVTPLKPEDEAYGKDVPAEFVVPASAAQWLRAIRSRRRLSQRELAQLAAIPASTVSRIESGASDPRFGSMLALFTATGHELLARDRCGHLVMRTSGREAVRDRGQRHPPAHLRLFRTPNYTSVHYRDWWGWDRIAFGDGQPEVPEWTYWRRLTIPVADDLVGLSRERGYLWDDAT